MKVAHSKWMFLGPHKVLVTLVDKGIEFERVMKAFQAANSDFARALREVFSGIIRPALAVDPQGEIARSLGWTRERATGLATLSDAELMRSPSLLLPGEPVDVAEWANGVQCRPGDVITLMNLDRIDHEMRRVASVKVGAIRRVGPGVFDLVCDLEATDGLGDVSYMGKFADGTLVVAGNDEDTRFVERPDAGSILRPPPPTLENWKVFEERVGFKLPAALFELFCRPKPLICEKRLRFPSFADLSSMHPVRSHRMLTVCMIENCGDDLCLFVPRENVAPFVVIHRLELGHVLPIADDAEAFFQDPDAWRRRMDLYGDDAVALPIAPEFQSLPWNSLKFDSENPAGEREFLNDLALTQEEATESRFFELAYSRFSVSDEIVPRSVRAVFSKPHDALNPGKWRQLAELLAEGGRPTEAIRALENCVTVTVPQALPDGWERVAQTYERMLRFAEEAGDAWDRTAIPVMIREARRWRDRGR